MAKDKVRKGFFFYFSFFILILIAAVLVIFVVMMFMPGTSILGLEYFTNSSQYRITNTTDESATAIDFKNPTFNAVEVNAGYAEVIVQNNNDFEQSGIYLINHSRGFVTSAKANDYTFSVTIEDGVLKINVSEQNAFLYFSKEVKVVLHVANNTEINPFNGKSIKITTTEGNVNIGGNVRNGYCHEIKVASLDVTSKLGNITISTLAPSSYDKLSLTTDSGDIKTGWEKLSANSMLLETGSGEININSITSANEITLNSTSGNISIGTVDGNLSSKFKDAYVTLGNVNGYWNFTPSEGVFSSSVIKVNSVGGDFIVKNGQNTKFEIGHIAGKAEIETSSGSVNIFTENNGVRDYTKGLTGYSIIKTSSGDINVNVATGSNSAINLDTKKGTINVSMSDNFYQLVVNNETSTTNILLPTIASVQINFYYYGQTTGDGFTFENVNLNLEGVEPTNPVVLNAGINRIFVKCNRTVNFSWY